MALTEAACFSVALSFLWWPSIGQAQPNKDLYELQERCGKRAEEVFNKTYKRMSEADGAKLFFDFENHYNPRLNKCFILVTRTTFKVVEGKLTEQTSETTWLRDLNDNREYGTYVWFSTLAAPFTCEVRGKQCRSEQEWRELIKPFMED